MGESLSDLYKEKRKEIKSRLDEFKNLKEGEYFKEFLFCLITPQSNAKKCWQAIQEISKLEKLNEENVQEILRTRTRFYNNKTSYIVEALESWEKIKTKLSNSDVIELRNWLAENVKGYGLKEASHFLRNIGKSKNEIAILDRHILRNLKILNVIENDKIKNKKEYFEIEKKFIDYSENIGIPIDELDLLFWSNETGEIFK